MKVPSWLTEGSPTCRCCTVGNGKKNFVERTLVEIAALMERSIFSEKYATSKGLLQSLDPRVKLVTILLLVVSTSLVKQIEIILGLYTLSLLFAYLSKVELSFFIKRVWLFIPIFSGIIAIPVMFNIVTPGEPLITLLRFDRTFYLGPLEFSEVSITKPGLLGAVLFISRVATSVSLVVLLTLTTRWTDLLKSLSTLRIPQTFVLVLTMTYQYIFLLVRLVQEMHLARKSRTIRALRTKNEQNWVASRIGTILLKSYKMSDEIHSAMISRGFRGEAKSLSLYTLKNPDFLWAGFSAVLFTTIIWLTYLT